MSDNIEKAIGQINENITTVAGQLKAQAERAQKNGELAESTKAQVDTLLQTNADLMARLQGAEQVLARLEAGPNGGDVQSSFGEQFVASEDFQAFASKSNPRGRVDMTVKAAITTLTTDADGSAGDGIAPNRLPGVNMLPQRRLTIRDLIAPGRTDTGLIQYVKETGFTNAAAPVAEGAAKPESSIKFDLVSETTKVIAHYFKASRQILSDFPQLASIINQRGMYGLKLVEENQILNGDGTGQNLSGLVANSTAYAAPFDPAGTETNIDVLRLAMLQVHLAEYAADGIVIHPSDWARVELLKDTTGRYLIGNPQGTTAPTLWGLPVVATQAMTVDKFLVGAFRMGAQVFDQWQARVEVATENDDDFIKNLVTVLVEERLALAIYRDESFVYGDFGNVP